VLQEMMAAGWSNRNRVAVRSFLGGWYVLLGTIAKEATVHGRVGPLWPDDIAASPGNAFLGWGHAAARLRERASRSAALRRFGRDPPAGRSRRIDDVGEATRSDRLA
jgi:hypothetical protein